MPNTLLDTLDKELIRLLAEDGRIPIGSLAKRLEVKAPTLRKRIANLKFQERGPTQIFRTKNILSNKERRKKL
jgi:predicted ArsR family transcriptional regulator